MNRGLLLVLVLLFSIVLCMNGCRPNVLPVLNSPATLPTRTMQSPNVLLGSDILIFSANGDLLTILMTGEERRNMTSSLRFETAPAISPNGEFVAAAVSERGTGDIMGVPWQGVGDPERYTNITQSPEFDDATPCWSPDGRQIAFTSYRYGNWGIFTAELMIYDDDVEPILLRQRRITSNKFFDGHPAWSPDGSWIAYTSDRGFRWQIYLSHTEGMHTMPMTGTTNLRSTAYPAWSPDGSQLTFASTFDGSWDIYILQSDGSNLFQLTSHPASDWNPTWSPDGSWIAFVSDRSGVSDIYLISTDGQQLMQLTETEEPEVFPVWQSQKTTLTSLLLPLPDP